MNSEMVIRNETDADVGPITEVTIAALKTLEISNQTEQFIIEALRTARRAQLRGATNSAESANQIRKVPQRAEVCQT
jgi:predicted N-acetyltransferase YhbS